MKLNERKGMFHNTSNKINTSRNKKICSIWLVMVIFLASFTVAIIITPSMVEAGGEVPPGPSPSTVVISDEGDSWDNYMRQRVIYRGTNYGTLEYIWIDANGALGYRNRGLIKFDIEGNVPAGCSIVSASLGLYRYSSSGSSPTGKTVRLYRLKSTRPWKESGSSSSCWNKYTASSWYTIGASSTSYDTESAYALTTVPSSGWMYWNVLTDVNYFYGGGTNNGWMFRYSSESGGESITKFRSSEYDTDTYDPKLTITYIEKPSCQTNDIQAGGVGETSATLRGQVTDDGGDYCNYQFSYNRNLLVV